MAALKDEKWFDYLSNCYQKILNDPDFLDHQNLLVFLFVLVHEIGFVGSEEASKTTTMPPIWKFDKTIEERFAKKMGRVEYDDSFVEMLSKVAKPDIVLEKGQEDVYVRKVLKDMYVDFDRFFNISKINKAFASN